MRQLVYGHAGFPEWGTLFAEIEDDAKEVGHEFIRLLMEQTAQLQAAALPAAALTTGTDETPRITGLQKRTIETESGPVNWNEPQAHLPKSRKAFFPSIESPGTGG
ncbi:MAG TPA: hypothetical protein VMM56_03425 [Planctomycetaceae bacterium]|nr:hypothetical protein [Planctomycetaceae bacterium]